ncbi:MAG: ELM1/GtrOC1 family putative glycosyltransferase [Candidatus Omnitrophota bacterium]
MNFLNSYLSIRIVKLISIILRGLPLGAVLAIGRFMGTLLYYVNLKGRRIAFANLRLAFASKYSPSQIRKIVKGVFQNTAGNAVEVLRFPALNNEYLDKYVKIEGFERIKKALGKRKGVVLLTAHFGNWELSAQASSLRGCPMMVLASQQRHSRLNDLLNYYRGLHGSKVISKGMQLREILKGLKNNEIVGILCDQDGGKEGIETGFFGRAAFTARGPFEIALRNNSDILPCFSVREENGRHTIYVGDALKAGGEDKEEILKNYAKEFNRLLEEKISQFPAQWLWTLKRWKSSRERAMVIISDGKAGHVNQAKAAAEVFAEKFKELGFRAVSDYQNKKDGYRIIEIRFRGELRRALFKLCARFFMNRFLNSFVLLKLALCEESFKEVQSCYADIFISAGSGAAGVNLLLARANMAKSVVIMKPPLAVSYFNLAIMPAHDLTGGEGRNVIEVLGAPVWFSPEFIEAKAAELRGRLNAAAGDKFIHSRPENRTLQGADEQWPLSIPLKGTPGFSPRSFISLFFGGDTQIFSYNKTRVKEIVSAVKDAAQRLNSKILVTTSRRSPEWLEEFIRHEFANDKKCAFLLIANKNNIPNAAASFIGLSKVAVVAGESISMVSEAASADRQLIVFMPDKKTKDDTKAEKVIRRLAAEGYLETAKEELAEQIISLFKKGTKKPFLLNREKIASAAKNLL